MGPDVHAGSNGWVLGYKQAVWVGPEVQAGNTGWILKGSPTHWSVKKYSSIFPNDWTKKYHWTNLYPAFFAAFY